MMLPISRFKGQPVSMVPTTPWLSISSDPAPPWFWLASWSASTFQAACLPRFYLPAVWIPDHTHLLQWERPAVEIVPTLLPFYQISPIHSHHPLSLSKVAKCWVSPEDVGVHPRRDKALFLTSQSIVKPAGHTPLRHLLLPPSQFSGATLWDAEMVPRSKHDKVCSSVQPCQPIISHKRRPAAPMQKCVFGPISRSQLCIDQWSIFPLQMIKEVCPSFLSSRCSTKFSLLTGIRHKRPGRGKVSCRGTLVLRTAEETSDNRQCVGVSLHKTKEEDKEESDVDEEKEEENKDKRPVASTPIPGSPWCVVWTGDDRVFFFNPTIHLSVWERPEELINYDISDIIKNPPHKRKRTTSSESSSICQLHGLHGDDDDEEEEHSSKKKRIDESLSLVPHGGEVKILPVELRITHFRDMMLERGVSAFSTWEKELHKMVFDPRYLLLTSDQRKQVFDQFVKSRLKDEYREKKSKKQKAQEEFKLLLEEAKITSRSTFKEFCGRYRGDQRFHTVNRKKEQKVLFNQFIKSLKKRDKDIKDGQKKMR
ncbi:transcription elongation regulator 1-like protein isoform X1 [Nothobranchius furzeri]|uniref:Transcript variant X1 n=1 Tax=Nothobranchius furzeri TaxID=105023 RepID=A0A9D2XJX7_NOTFU|nr:transcript variant X1 [Nothobranchius furzeri]